MANGKEEWWPMERRSGGQWKGGAVANGKEERWPIARRGGALSYLHEESALRVVVRRQLAQQLRTALR